MDARSILYVLNKINSRTGDNSLLNFIFIVIVILLSHFGLMIILITMDCYASIG